MLTTGHPHAPWPSIQVRIPICPLRSPLHVLPVIPNSDPLFPSLSFPFFFFHLRLQLRSKERAAYQAAGLPIPSLKYRNRNRRTETTEVTEDYPKRNSMQLERTRQQAPHHRPTPLRSSEGSASPAFESDAPFQPVTSPSPFSVTASAPFHVYNNEGAVHPNAHPPGEYAYHTMSFPSIPANAYSNPGPLLRDFPSSAPISPMYTTEKKLPTAWPLSDESFMPAHPQPPPEHPHALDHPPSWPLSPESSGSWPETVPVGPPGGGGPPLGTANGLPTSQSSHLTYDFPHFPPPQHDYSSVGPEPMYPQYRGTGASTTLMYPRSSVQFPPS